MLLQLIQGVESHKSATWLHTNELTNVLREFWVLQNWLLGSRLQQKLTTDARFKKWTFVWDKNPQRRHLPYSVQLFILNINVTSILKFIQRFILYFNFSFWVIFAPNLPVNETMKTKNVTPMKLHDLWWKLGHFKSKLKL